LLVAVLLVCAFSQLGLALYGLHRCATVARFRRARRRPLSRVPRPRAWPRVTVQLPVHNEVFVVERLVDAACALDYPRECLEIQVLDDSDDETTALAERAAARGRARGVDVRVLHRRHRAGFKAGALQTGLRAGRGELAAVFDADFLPDPDFLRRVVPHFADPGVGAVQARWGHLNRDHSALTRAQAVLLDAHFVVEHGARAGAGLFFNFNGAAGVWRRRCIEQVGGWQHDTLTEDLDLSYRAQLAGWRLLYLPEVAAPAELPVEMSGFKSQQRRWAKGSIQTARKLLPAIWRSGLPWRVKLEAAIHLTNNVAYVLLLGGSLLVLPAMALPNLAAPTSLVWAWAGLFVLATAAACFYFVTGQRALGAGLASAVRGLPGVMALAAGLSLNNAAAVLGGLRREVGSWERTPKYAVGPGRRPPRAPRYGARRSTEGLGELLLAAYFATSGWLAWRHGHWEALPGCALLAAGFLYVGWASRGPYSRMIFFDRFPFRALRVSTTLRAWRRITP
jgi:glycosyltransferase involved in cell wall biosynthesis